MLTVTIAGAVAGRVPQRVPTPPLDEGPHLSYAIQWFSFAAIALAGTVMAVFVMPTYRATSRAGSGTVE